MYRFTSASFKNLSLIKNQMRYSSFAVGDKVPKQMKYISHENKMGPESITVQTCDVPEYNPQTEVLIKVEATAANRADLLQTQGKYPPPKGVTNILGLECSGYLVDPKTNEITDRRVMALMSGGAYADFAKVHKDHIIDIAPSISFAQAAAIPEAWITAYQLLHTIAHVQEGETALILAAASGVGTSMIQLCKLAGVSAVAVASNDCKIEECIKIGAFCGINYKQYPSYSERLQLVTDGHGADVILDPVMGTFFNCNLDCLAMDGRWVIYGFMGGIHIKEANMMKLLNRRGSILTSTLRNRTDSYKSDLMAKFSNHTLDAFESGKLKPIIDKTLGLKDAKEGLIHMEQGANVGKIVFVNDL